MVLEKRIIFKIWILCVILLAAGCVFFGGCGEKKKVYRVGILSGLDAFQGMADGFIAGMTELGYIEGENITYDLRRTNMDLAEIRQILKQFVDDKVDMIYTFPTEPAVEAKTVVQSTNIPVVFASANIEGVDLVDSVGVPGGNITGCRYPGPDLAIKRFEILSELMPQLKRLGIIYNINYPANKPAIEVLRPVAVAAGVTLVEVPVTDIKQIQDDFRERAEAADIGMDAILIMPDDFTQSPAGWTMVAEFAAGQKIPIAGSAGFEADTGAVFSYIPDNVETGKLAATVADKIFKGTPAGKIMVITPYSKLRLNYKAIKALGLTAPDGLLSQADEVIH